MASILTLRLPPAKLARVDRRAAELGRDRSAYVRALIDQDLERPADNRRHKFASEDLIGAFDTGQGTADNATVRRLVRQRLRQRREKHC
jgi:predicted DNA-binding protein